MAAAYRAVRCMIFVASLMCVECLVPSPLLPAELQLANRRGAEMYRSAGGFLAPKGPSSFGSSARSAMTGSTLMMAAAGAIGSLGGGLYVAKAAVANVASSSIQLAISKFMGYGILVGSLFLQMPQILQILMSRSVIGISRASRYAEVPINSSAVIYHFLKRLPFSTYGENVAVLIQNILCVILVWIWEAPRVKVAEMILVTAAFVTLCTVQLSLPASLHPILIYINLPLVLGSCLPQIMANFRQGHTGQLAILSNFLKLVGCSVRIFTTITQIGLDPGLLCNYVVGAIMNLTIVLQGIAYREKTLIVRMEEKKRKEAADQALQGKAAS